MIKSLTSISLIPLLIMMSLPRTALAADPASLQLKVVEGDGAAYAPGSRATRGVTVEVQDQSGRPVEGATVGFTLPMTGPSGEFASGGLSEIIVTRGDGMAAAWGMRWNRTAGPFEVRVTAVKGPAHAEASVRQFLSGLPQSSSSAKNPGGGGGHAVLWILLAGAAAAGAAGFALKGGSSSSSGTSAPPGGSTATGTGVQIGTPTITVGRP